MGATETLVRFALETRLEDLPPGVVEAGKLRALDTLAVMVGGCNEKCTQIAAGFARKTGGAPQAQVVGHALQTSAPNAAFVNGVAAHALDYDDIPRGGLNHISVCVFPAALAAAELVGVGGSSLLLGYILGYEVEARIGNGVNPPHILQGWHPPGTLGSFGAAIAAAKVLGLDEERTRWALGIAGSATGGIRKNIGTMTKPFHAGHGARNGVTACMLAADGYTADPNILEGTPGTAGHDHFGFCETFNGDGKYDLERMVAALGQEWHIPNTITKQHPGPTAPAVPIDITLDLVRQHNIRPQDVERVVVEVTPITAAIACYRHPKTGLDGRYSLWYSIAVSILDRKAGLLQYTDGRAQQPDVHSFMNRVEVVSDSDIQKSWDIKKDPLGSPARVTIRLKDGRSFSDQRAVTKGYVEMPVGWGDIVDKLMDCAEYSGLASKGVDLKGVGQMVAEMERLPKASSLLEGLRPRPA